MPGTAVRCRLECAKRQGKGIRVAGNFRFVRIEADQPAWLSFRKMANGCDLGSRTDFERYQAVDRCQPALQVLLLQRAAPFQPLPVAEHQDVGPCQLAATWAKRWITHESAVLAIDFGLKTVGRPYFVTTCGSALQVVDRAMHFANPPRPQSRLSGSGHRHCW